MTKRYISTTAEIQKLNQVEINAFNNGRVKSIFSGMTHAGVMTRGSSSTLEERLNEFFKTHYLEFTFRNGTDYDSDHEIGGTIVKAIPYGSPQNAATVKEGYMYKGAANLSANVPTQTVTNKAGKAMKNVKDKAVVLGGGMVSGNKEALGMATKLQAGRANNKVIKEAVRPLVKLMFKPSFMQRLLAKVFRTENPIDKFLDSPYGGLFAAQVAQAVVSAKGVENEKVKAVVIGGLAHSYNELGDKLIPIDTALDSVVKTLTETAEKFTK